MCRRHPADGRGPALLVRVLAPGVGGGALSSAGLGVNSGADSPTITSRAAADSPLPLHHITMSQLLRPPAAAAAAAAAAAPRLVRRAAFDIGSGMTKMQVSDVDVATGTVVSTHHAEEREVLFAADWKRSGPASVLSDPIQRKGLETLGALKAIAEELGAVELRGVATEVFRKAANGAGYLTQVESKLGIRSTLVAQVEEARLGWLTAVAGGRAAPDRIVSWDSGGGSFQITARPDGGELCTYMGSWGSTIAAERLTTAVRGLEYSEFVTANPVGEGEARALVDYCKVNDPRSPASPGILLISIDSCRLKGAS